MIPLLAQTMPSATDLASFLGCIAFFLGILVGVKKLREKPAAPTPQPLVVQGHVQFVPRDEFDKEITKAHGRIGRERGEVNAMIAEIKADTTREIQAVAAQVAQHAVDGEKRVVRINERIDALRDDIKDAPAATVALLRQTKGLL